jgi:DNA polymerase II small subunit
MTNNIILKFAKKGINLSPQAYNKIMSVEDPIDFSSSLILKLRSKNYSKDDLVSLNESVIDHYLEELGLKPKIKENKSFKSLDNFTESKETTKPTQTKPKETTKPTQTKPKETTFKKKELNKEKNIDSKNSINDEISNKNLIKVNDEEVNEEFKRNLIKTNVNYDNFEILKDTTNQSYTSGELSNLIAYFNNRYEKLSKIIEKHPEMKTHQKINNIGEGQTDLNLILMVKDIRTTKNGHNLVEFEDDTGDIAVLFSNKNEDTFKLSEKLIRDEVVGITADKRGDLAIGNNIVFPGVPRMPKVNSNCGIVFTSDIHIGSITFLEDAFVKFIKWLNGDYGNEEQREIANNVKYLTVDGDIVDGIGVYPNQDKELAIKDITEQYDEAARLLGDVRSDIKIIIGPGNHDASRLAEPQPAVPEKYAKSLYKLNNVEFISNPGYINLDGTKVLMYHGRGIDDFAIGVKDYSHERNDLIMEEFLNIRHLAPIYGERTPLASELEDHLVIDEVPNVLHTGHVHINTYKNYKGIHLINSGTFQTQTEFQKIYNIVPTPAQVPILDNGEYKQLKFID